MLPRHYLPAHFQMPYELGVIILILQARGLWLREVKGPAGSCTAQRAELGFGSGQSD